MYGFLGQEDDAVSTIVVKVYANITLDSIIMCDFGELFGETIKDR